MGSPLVSLATGGIDRANQFGPIRDTSKDSCIFLELEQEIRTNGFGDKKSFA